MKGYTIQNSIDLLEKGGTGSGGATTASQVSYDNTSSHMTADNVQEAVDELNTAIGQIDTGVHYSDTEHVVGTWTDGKVLYERTIHSATPTKAASIQHGIENVEHIFIHDIDAKQNTNPASTTRCGIYYLSGTDYFGAVCSPGTVFVDWGSGVSINDLYVTLRYTKVTPVTNTRKRKKED